MKKEIILKSLELSNFRGQSKKVAFNVDATKIKGKNGVGKSTIMKAFYWLLTGYPSPTEIKNYNLFDNRVELSPDTPKASVKATFSVDGYECTLEKIAEAKFTRKRGSNTYEKATSDTYTLLLDNIETTNSAFNDWVEYNICPIDMLPYCLDGGFFVELLNDDKDKARNTLEKIIGEIKNEDMNGDYSLIQEDMKRYSIDMIEERTKNEVKPLKKRLEEIPAIIDDKEKTIAEYESVDFTSLHNDIEKTKREIDDIDNAILGQGKAIEPILGERNRILNIINDRMVDIQNAKNAYLAKESAKTNEVKRAIQEIKFENENIRKRTSRRLAEMESKRYSQKMYNESLQKANETRAKLIADKNAIKERVFTNDHCLYCGQELPQEKIEEAREKFNAQKEKDYNAIVEVGKTNSKLIAGLQEEIDALDEIIGKGIECESEKDTTELEQELAKLQSSFIPFESTKEYAHLSAKIKDLEATLPTIPTDDTESLTLTKKSLMGTLETLNRRYGLKAKADELRTSIATLRDEIRSIGIEIAKLEGKIDKCKEYRQEKAEIISYRVNARLTEAHIDMYSTQKDGTIKPDVVLRGKELIKYGSLNFSNQIKTKVELQDLFMSHFDISLPTFVDEMSIFDSQNVPKKEGQVIYLYATDDNYLVVE